MTAVLPDTVAVVTGASSGIGRAVALRLAELGSTVALVGRDTGRLAEVQQLIEGRGGTAISVPADVSDLDSIGPAIERVHATFARLDIAVACAGAAVLAPFLSSDPRQWRTMIDANVTGFVNTAHCTLGHLLASAASRPDGVADLVAISSTSGRRPLAGNNVYGATKHAVTALAESLRQEVTERSVRVGLVSPGMVATPMTQAYADAMPFEFLSVADVADAVEYMVTRRPGAAVNEMVLRSTHQAV